MGQQNGRLQIMYTKVTWQLVPTSGLIVSLSLQIVNVSSESVFPLVSLLEFILAVQPSSAKDNPFRNYLYLFTQNFLWILALYKYHNNGPGCLTSRWGTMGKKRFPAPEQFTTRITQNHTRVFLSMMQKGTSSAKYFATLFTCLK